MSKKLKKLRESVGPTVQMTQLPTNEYQSLVNNVDFYKESLAELEMSLDLRGYQRVTGTTDWEFSRDTLNNIIKLARVLTLKNPLVKRSVEVQALYTFALGYELETYHEDIKAVLDEFLADPINDDEWGSEIALMKKDRQLSQDGNLFLAIFADRTSTGMVRFRPIDVFEITDIVTNPDDKYEPWLYKRVYSVGPTDPLKATGKTVTVYHPDYRYTPVDKPNTYGKDPINWGVPIYHVKGPVQLDAMRFSIPEIYSILDWSGAYKNFLEDWATIMRAYSKMAMQVSNLKGKKGVAAAKSQMGVVNATDGGTPGAANLFMSSGGVELKAIKTAGSTTSAEEGRPLKLMIAAGAGLPETFFGDADVGNFATSETLDRPTELAMLTRQKLWKRVMSTIFGIVIDVAAEAGIISGASVTVDIDPIDPTREKRVVVMPKNSNKAFGATDKPVNRKSTIKFPNVLERNMDERIRSIVGAFTMNGRQLTNIIDDRRLLAELILESLQVENRREIVDRLYPPGEDVEPIPEPIPPGAGGFGDGGGEDGKPANKKSVGPTEKRTKGKNAK